ncbi:agmatine deiminase family protein [Methylolobus aquaticus]
MTHRHFPPEWAEQSAVLIAWPTRDGAFADCLDEAVETYVHIATAISRREIVLIACSDPTLQAPIRDRIEASQGVTSRVRFVDVPYDDIWVRDTAPLSIETSAGPILLNFRFNGWGGKYDCANDAAFGSGVVQAGVFCGVGTEASPMVLEGGSIETDGAGTLLTTRFCLSNPNRNPDLSAGAIEAELTERLGIDRLLWLDHGHVAGDDTDAHVDTLARFCDEHTIAFTACDDPGDPHYASLSAMAEELRSFRTRTGLPYRLIPLPIPQPILAPDGTRLPATYANFLIINEAVLVPIYGDANDALAIERLDRSFPGREIVPIDCRILIRQYGSLHCMTMQFPKTFSLTSP